VTAGGAAFAAGHAPVLVAAGIAEPRRLVAAIEASGVAVADCLAVDDHAALPRAELEARARSTKAVVTTAKDYWRDPSVFAGLAVPAFVVPVRVELAAEDRAALLERLGS
jgi:tetraacyldisaccharide-1-P 4'-kinase